MQLEHGNLTSEAYQAFLAQYNGDDCLAFASLVRPIVDRFCRQTGRPLIQPDVILNFAYLLWQVSGQYGFPEPLDDQAGDEGFPMDLDEVAELMAQILDVIDTVEYRLEIAILSNQFLKAILQPEFKRCRLSYCRPNSQGLCERQSLAHVRQRISGAHCSDCPLFILTKPAVHPKVLKAQWEKAKVPELEANLGAFLPEDFRQLKYFLHLHRRYAAAA